MVSEKSKYQRWYDELMQSRRLRSVNTCYVEVHHIVPRSMDGGDEQTNLVTLTYREHFVAHWLLTKFCKGADLFKMRRALFAMTLPAKGARIIAGWQFEVAKRAVKDLVIANSQRIAAEQAAAEAKKEEYQLYELRLAHERKDWNKVAIAFLESQRHIKSTELGRRRRTRRRRPRGGRRRQRLALAS